MKNLELLAPAGSYDGLVAAINAGADAVYIGGQKFGARAYAENPEDDLLIAGIEYAHLRNKKVYLTVNTLLKNGELKELYDYIKKPYEAGLDAVIVQDLGVLSFIRQQFPNMDIHASTQMSITGLDGFKWLENQGVTRVVPARELSLKELEYIHKNSSLEIEAFIHGALCYCYSGQCLLSSLIGGRSGNRGRCAQPCRLPYTVSANGDTPGRKQNKPEFLLSPKDLCTIDYIPRLIEAGVTSFKIEGRMKRPEYAAGVVEIYRKAIDGIAITDLDRTQLLNLYSRSGNCSGYLENHNGKSMITLDSPSYRTGEDDLFNRINKDYLQKKHSLPIHGTCVLKYGQPAVLNLKYNDISVQVMGDCPDYAKNQPMEADAIKKRLAKTGETDFVFSELDVSLADGLFMSVQSLNRLRRDGLDLLKTTILTDSRRVAPLEMDLFSQKIKPKNKVVPTINVLVTSLEQAQIALKFPEIADVYIDTVAFSLKEDLTPYQNTLVALKKAHKRVFLALPHIFRQNTKEAFTKAFEEIFPADLDGCLIRNWESYTFLQEELGKRPEYRLTIRSDSNMYCFNSLSKNALKEQSFEKITLPVELNQKELPSIADETNEWIVYSYLPLMVSAQCIRNTAKKCTKKQEILYLKDRLKKEFAVRNYCDCCYNIIYNGAPMILWDKEIPAGSYRLDFHLESPTEMRNILLDATSAITTKKAPQGNFTRGHFTRGVE